MVPEFRLSRIEITHTEHKSKRLTVVSVLRNFSLGTAGHGGLTSCSATTDCLT